MKLYLLRHQAGGILPIAFRAPPTEAQIAAVRENLERTIGHQHPKTGAYWIRPIEVDSYGDEIPVFEQPAEQAPNELPAASLSAVVRVENP